MSRLSAGGHYVSITECHCSKKGASAIPWQVCYSASFRCGVGRSAQGAPRASQLLFYDATAALPSSVPRLCLRHSRYSTLFRHVPLPLFRSCSLLLQSPLTRSSPATSVGRSVAVGRRSVPFAISRALASGLRPGPTGWPARRPGSIFPPGETEQKRMNQLETKSTNKPRRGSVHLFSEALGAQIPKAINFVTSRKAGRTEAGKGGHTCLSREVIFP